MEPSGKASVAATLSRSGVSGEMCSRAGGEQRKTYPIELTVTVGYLKPLNPIGNLIAKMRIAKKCTNIR